MLIKTQSYNCHYKSLMIYDKVWKESLLVEGVAGEETNLELHQQEVRKVLQLKDIKAAP